MGRSLPRRRAKISLGSNWPAQAPTPYSCVETIPPPLLTEIRFTEPVSPSPGHPEGRCRSAREPNCNYPKYPPRAAALYRFLPARWRKSCSKAQDAFERFPTLSVARGAVRHAIRTLRVFYWPAGSKINNPQEGTALRPRAPDGTGETAFRLSRNYPKQKPRASEILFQQTVVCRNNFAL